MADSANLYTTGQAVKAVVDSVTSEATGFLIENAFDFNPDTYWKATSTADQAIDIDMGQVITVDSFAIWIHNNTTTWTTPASIAVYTDDNDDGNYTTTTAFKGSAFTNSSGVPIYFPNSASSSTSKRYWRIQLTNMTSVIEISQFFFLKTRALTQGNEFPEADSEIYYNDVVKAPGGRKFVQNINSNKVQILNRQYKFSGTTNWTALQNAFNDCKGSLYPLILEENSTYHYVRFNQDELNKNETDYQYYQPKVQFESIPYIPDGETL